ncbi:hypothetical protein B0T14DRAFT_114923 [Immersiella caudata]|uniref:Uncharacterized protein n=1 Tax=Immersiella caudata TaxID=314043 RepID=A0AA39X4E6_9PEZI|nr:hypothetical protein B0T14DRAFT_114923 [Immersiella caudata]
MNEASLKQPDEMAVDFCYQRLHSRLRELSINCPTSSRMLLDLLESPQRRPGGHHSTLGGPSSLCRSHAPPRGNSLSAPHVSPLSSRPKRLTDKNQYPNNSPFTDSEVLGWCVWKLEPWAPRSSGEVALDRTFGDAGHHLIFNGVIRGREHCFWLSIEHLQRHFEAEATITNDQVVEAVQEDKKRIRVCAEAKPESLEEI